MTRGEIKVMQEHLTYWKELTDRNFVVIFVPAADPNGFMLWRLLKLMMKQLSMALA
jgi:hypothetical protein